MPLLLAATNRLKLFRLAYRAAQQLALLRVFKLDRLGLKDHRDRLVLLVLRVLQAQLARRVMLVPKDLKAQLAILVQRDLRGQPVLREILVLVAQLVQQAATVQLARRVILVQPDRKVKLAQLDLQVQLVLKAFKV